MVVNTHTGYFICQTVFLYMLGYMFVHVDFHRSQKTNPVVYKNAQFILPQ